MTTFFMPRIPRMRTTLMIITKEGCDRLMDKNRQTIAATLLRLHYAARINVLHDVIMNIQTPEEFENEYTRRAIGGGFDVVDASIRAYDVVWVVALALNNTLSMVRSGDISETGCDNVPGSLVPLEDFDYTNERMGCLIQWNMQQTNFSGVSVSSYIPYIEIVLWKKLIQYR